jgi:hypothetical protein
MAASKRVQFISHFLSRLRGYLVKGDTVQSSEKLYKAAEECFKALSERLRLPEVKDADEKGRWTVTLLERAVRKLSDKIGIDVQLGWDATNHLHV